MGNGLRGSVAGMMTKRFAVQVGALALVALAAVGVRAEPEAGARSARPEPNGVSDNVRVDACANDPSVLGLSRVVEIDTLGGPQFGSAQGQATNFLKDGEVILTFDDGPLRAYTRPVLKALAAHCTRATFFMVGRMAAADPAMVKEVAQAGHTVGSHTWSHQNQRALTLLKARQEFEMGVTGVSKALGRPASPFFRFPYLSENRGSLGHIKSRNVSAFWVDIDSKDYLTRDAKSVHRRVMAELAHKRKGIILMHDIQPATAGAIKGLLDDLHAKGFKVVHIVPKTSVDTVATYDSTVDQTFASNSAKAASNPLASRSVVWTMAPAGAGAAGSAAAKAPSAGKPAKAAAVGAQEDLPWLKAPPAATPAATVPPPKSAVKPARTKPQAEVLPWQPTTFGY